MLIRKQFRFEAAHVLPHHNGKCARLHGHSYKLEVTIAGPLRSTGPDQGMVMDFGDLSAIVKSEVLERLDHSHLNDLLPNPTCECILEWITDALSKHIPLLDEVVLWETDTACAALRLNQPLSAPTSGH